MSNGSFFPLPAVVDPPRICVQIEIPNERNHIAAFLAMIERLGFWFNWERDSAHTALETSILWNKIFLEVVEQINLQNPTCPIPAPPLHGTEIEDFMPIRVDCDCNVWITCCDGTEKQLLTADQIQKLLAPQPGGDNTPQPQPGGQCVLYQGTMGAKEPWYVPTLFNTGDTIEFTHFDGLTNDGGSIDQRCADGGLFFGGNTHVTYNVGTDPLPTVPHMKIIGNINGTFYDIFPGPFTIPSGISNGQMTLQVNDYPLTNNSGTLTFEIKVCNNKAAKWTEELDFTLSPSGFTNDVIGSPAGTWIAGDGWRASEFVLGGDHYWGLAIQRTIPSTIITGVSVPYQYLIGQHAGPDIFHNELGLNGTGVDVQDQPATGDGNLTFVYANPTGLATTNITIIIVTAKDGGSTPSPTGGAIVPQITIQGLGDNPFS